MALVVPKGDTASEKAVLKELSGLDEVDYAMGLSNVEAKPGYFLTDKLTPRQFSEMMGLSYEEACILYAAYTADQEDNFGPIVGGIDSYTVSAMDMILFIYQEKEKGYHHKCAVCGRTDVTNPELQFRYCSKCAGYHCFCSDHIFNHVHFTDEQP